jgi:hypothetical protein
MAKKNGRADFVTPWEYHAALLPVRFRDKSVPVGTGYNGSDFTTTAETGRPVPAEYADEIERKRFYEALLELPWLAPKIRAAIMRELGRSQRDAKVGYGDGVTAALKFRVEEVEARMRANGERPPRGGFYSAAVEEVAGAIGMKSETLERRIRRLKG